MEQIFESLKSLIDPLVGKAADVLGENPGKVSGASKGILAGLLGQLASDGYNQQLENVVHDAANANILSHLGAVFGAKGGVEQAGIGHKFLQAVFGAKTKEFTNAVASDSGLSKESSSQLTNMISTAVAGFFGDKVKNGGFKFTDLLRSLNEQKGTFAKIIPAALASVSGLGLAAGKAINPSTYTDKKKNGGGGGMGWLLWLLLAIALVLLIVFGWRSCRNRLTKTGEKVKAETEQAADAVAEGARNVAEKLGSLVLPDGRTIEVRDRGVENSMVAFLNSDAYKNARTDADLARRWFEFEDIDFARDSATDLDSKAELRIRNIAAILKAFPNAKIKIGGNADLSGNRIYNPGLSEKRAERIKALLVQEGIASNRISTEGFGDEFAVWPASTDEQRSASDRDVAFRFTL